MGRGRDGLGHRGDAENRVSADGIAAPDRPVPDAIHVHFAAPADEGDDARHLLALDEPGHHIVQAAQPLFGQTAGAHGSAAPGQGSTVGSRFKDA